MWGFFQLVDEVDKAVNGTQESTQLNNFDLLFNFSARPVSPAINTRKWDFLLMWPI